MAKPKRTFDGVPGAPSVGAGGPDQIKYDLDNLFAALDPVKTFNDSSPGGIGSENVRHGGITDDHIDSVSGQKVTGKVLEAVTADRAINADQAATADRAINADSADEAANALCLCGYTLSVATEGTLDLEPEESHEIAVSNNEGNAVLLVTAYSNDTHFQWDVYTINDGIKVRFFNETNPEYSQESLTATYKVLALAPAQESEATYAVRSVVVEEEPE